MKLLFRAIISLSLGALSFVCFYFQPPSIVETTTTTNSIVEGTEQTVSESIETKGFSKMLDIVGLGALLLSIWIWRKELGIGTIGPLSGEPAVTQQQPSAVVSSSSGKAAAPMKKEDAYAQMSEHELELRKDYIAQLFDQYRTLNATIIANKLRITRDAAKLLLFMMQKEGIIRADGFPKSTIYSKADSIENITIDLVRQEIEQSHTVLQERRYVRISHRYEIDALFQCEDIGFIVEVKPTSRDVEPAMLEHWITQLTTTASEFSSSRVACILSIVILGITGSEAMNLKKRLTSYSYETGKTPVRTLVYTESDFQKDATYNGAGD